MKAAVLEINVLNPEFVQNQIENALQVEKLLNSEIEKTEQQLDKFLRAKQKLNTKMKIVERYNSVLEIL